MTEAKYPPLTNLTHPLYRSRFAVDFYSENPFFEPFFWEWEKSFDIIYFVDQATSYLWLSYVVIAIYILCIYLLNRYMENRKPFKIPKFLIFWNLGLFIFSIVAFFKVACWSLYDIIWYGVWYITCAGPNDIAWGGPHFLWIYYFAIPSKILELGDTVLLSIRKKKISFLHWYHHASVLLFCWRAFAHQMGMGVVFVVLNTFVHSVMYFYYTVSAISSYYGYPRPKWGLIVTIIQISQMFLGIDVVIMNAYWALNHEYCHIIWGDWLAAFIMYMSYFLLFVSFFFRRYVCDPCDDKKKLKTKNL